MITPPGPTTRPQPEVRARQRLDHTLIGAAIGWAAVLLILADSYPVETINTSRPGVQPMRSLVAVHGYGVLLPASIPLLIAIIVGLLLRAGPPSARWPVTAAWILSVALLLAALVGFVTFLIGIYVVPAGALLVGASARETSRRSAADAAPGPEDLRRARADP